MYLNRLKNEVKVLNMKKLLTFALFLVVVVSAVSAISAVSAAQDVTLEGIHFKILDGYNSVEKDLDSSKPADTEDIDGTNVDTKVTSEYKDSSGTEIEIEIGSRKNKNIDSINSGKGEKKSIAGKDGFLIKDTDDGKVKYKFEYLQDGKIVKISAPSEDIISQVIA